MTKTKEQVKRHIQNCSFNDTDWRMVLDYCKKVYGGGSMHRALKPKCTSTYRDFADWMDDGYASGDIVRCGDRICIVADELSGKVHVSVSVDHNGNVSAEQFGVSRNNVSKADMTDRKRLLGAISNNGFKYSVSLSRLVRTYRPKENSMVALTINGMDCYGVFKEFDGDLVRLHFYVREGIIVTGYHGKADVRMITKNGVDEIYETLKKEGLAWNYRTGKLERSVARVKKGDTYWYISDKFTIMSAKDSYLLTHNTRYTRGNYFFHYKEALDFLNMILEKRKESL